MYEKQDFEYKENTHKSDIGDIDMKNLSPILCAKYKYQIGSVMFTKSKMTEKQSWTNNGSHRSDVSGRNGSYIPPTVRKKLYSYFNDIESELDEAYKQIRLLREGLRPTEDGKSKNTSISETFRRKNLNDKYSPNVKRSTPITQKIRDTYKISTNRLVNTLKSNQNIYDYSAEFVYKKHTDGLWDVCVSPYQSHIYATASVDKTARIWDGNLNICRYEYCGHFGGVNSIRFYPNNDLLCLTASGDGTAQLWKRENLKNIQEKLYDSDSKNSCLTYQNVYNKKNLQQKFECGSTVVISADFVDESQIVAACWSNCAYLFDIEKNRKTKTLEHSQQLTNVNCLKNSKIILTSSKDKSFKMWDLRDSERSSVDSNIHNQYSFFISYMVFAKVIKNKSYFKRFQVKFKRRRQCKTDYYARKRLIFQDKNKYNSPKYRMVVRMTNKKIVAQIVFAKLQGDVVVCQATSAELVKYGITVGLTNYSAAYCTGLLIARRTLKKYKLDSLYAGNDNVNGEDYLVDNDQDVNSFHCNLDVGLKKTSTGANIFGVLKGAVDGGLNIPYSNKRFPGFKVEDEGGYNAQVHKDRIFGKHVVDYMALLKSEDEAKYNKCFSKYIAAGILGDKIEEMYSEAHKKIRNDPTFKGEKKETKPHKIEKKMKLTHTERKNKIKQKKAAFMKKLAISGCV
ncbi:hypothetical protein A3Q56_00946 [Intoshia linei]|uniref:Large ribosomal subunit protein uL18 n=1 Tax=Intoshia linei TaxID=1819745 RepID=A0A177BC87_9BILA|nr:hypothetical protein A3Q56_00946 [Intoshia linei]